MTTVPEQVYNTCLDYFNGNEMAAGTMTAKYLMRDKDGNFIETHPDEPVLNRHVPELYRIESQYEGGCNKNTIQDALQGYEKVLLHGSPSYGIGNDQHVVSLANCFVVGEVPFDSYSGILKMDHDIAQIQKRRGGVGCGLNTLRPNTSTVRNSACTSDGVSAFCDRFSTTTQEVGQNGRRGALIEWLNCRHPDIENFIWAKIKNEHMSGANLSVQWTDDFLKAVENDEEYTLKFPIDAKDNNATFTRNVNAKDVFYQAAHSAWRTGCPGCLFWDTMTGKSISDCYIETTGVNPCQPDFATVLTPAGIRTIGDIAEGSILWSGKQWTTIINKQYTGIKPVYEYETTRSRFIGTENHRVVQNGEKVEVQNADAIDWTTADSANIETCAFNPQDIMDGLVIGDGSYHKASDLVYLNIGENDYDYFDSEIVRLIGKHRPGLKESAYEVETSIVANETPKTYARQVPSRFFQGNTEKVCGFLRGLYSANGSVISSNNSTRIVLKQASRELIRQVQAMLSSLGISSYITTNIGKNVQFANGEYWCRESYDLNISSDRGLFADMIGFLQQYKNDRLKESTPRIEKPSDIKRVAYLGEMPVYDITVDAEEHTYWSEGSLVSNCGELGLSDHQACILMSMVLQSFVDNPFTAHAEFNWERFEHYLRTACHLIDDLVDLEIEKIRAIISKIDEDPEPEKIKAPERDLWQSILNKHEQYRKVGLGDTGLGDCLASLNLVYGTDEAIEFTDKLYQFKQTVVYDESAELAKQRGAFSEWDWEKEKDSHYIAILPEVVQDKIKKYGRRNLSQMTVAPTGSTTQLPGVTSGLEPVFSVSHTRWRKVFGNENLAPDKTDSEGNKWVKTQVEHPGFREWKRVTGKEKLEDSPYCQADAHSIHWKNRLRMQSAIQNYVDSSISSTVNLPEETTVEEIKDIYFEAWKLGLKGVTVYRNNCEKAGILEIDDRGKNQIARSIAPKRPEVLPCDIHYSNIKDKTNGVVNEWIIFVGKLPNGQIYEVFGGHQRNFKIPNKHQTGWIQKAKKDKYDLILGSLEDENEKLVIEDITHSIQPSPGSYTRLVSMLLRHGVSLPELCRQLLKDSEADMFTFEKGLSRVLKKYISDGEQAKEACPECGGIVQFIEGCTQCSNCGWSACE